MSNRISLIAAFSIAVTCLSGFSAKADDNDIALAKNSMRLMGGPSKAYPRIGMITWGQGLKVMSCQDNGWCEVVADGQRGWVPAEKIRLPDEANKRDFSKGDRSLRVTI